MVGGVTSGYSLIGSWVTAIKPPARMTSDSTTAKIGRSMKKREKRMEAGLKKVALPRRGCRCGTLGDHGSIRGGDLHSGANPHQAVYDYAFSGLEPRFNRAQTIYNAASDNGTILDTIVALQHEHELAILIGADRLVLNQDRRVLLAAEESYTREQSRCEEPVAVRQQRPRANSSRRSIDTVVNEIEPSHVRKSRLVGETDQ